MEEAPQDACKNCPVVMVHQDKIDFYNREIDHLLHHAFSDGPEQKAEYVHRLADQIGFEKSALKGTEDIAIAIREEASKMTNGYQKRIDELNELITYRQQTCQRPLGMRAVRDGIEYTAHICTSEKLREDGRYPEPSMVKRKKLPEN